MTTSTQTPLLSDLDYTTWPKAELNAVITVTEIAEIGDTVKFWNEDSKSWDLGVYLHTWKYVTEGRELSPFWGDTRTMAYIANRTGGQTFADVTTISKVVSSIPTAVL